MSHEASTNQPHIADQPQNTLRVKLTNSARALSTHSSLHVHPLALTAKGEIACAGHFSKATRLACRPLESWACGKAARTADYRSFICASAPRPQSAAHGADMMMAVH